MGVLLELADRIRITPYTARQTREAERERTRTIATLEAKVAQHLKRIESFGYGENYLDPMEQYRDGGELWYPTGYGVSGSANDRKGGQSWPFLFNEFQLQKMRGAARVLCDSNPFAIGARDRHCDFVVGDGMKPQVALRGTKPGSVASGGTVAPAVKAVQDVIDEWRELNSWGAGPWIGDIADPNDDAGYIGNKEREGYERAVVDGEVAVRFFAGGSSERGLPRIRWIEPELIVTPPGENITGPKGWGIETEPDDIERKLSYYVQGHDGIEGEYVESGRVVFGKLNTVSTVKRGVSDFAPVGPMLTRTLKLMDAMGEVSAILAQIAYLREHAPGTTSAQVSTMIGGAKDFDKSRRGGSYTTIPAQYQEPGTVHDVSNGMKYVAPPMQSGAPGFIQVEQAMLRAIGQRWGMPEFFSGDASNNNYASIAVTGSPFERAVKSRQQWYAAFQKAIYYKVIAYAVKSGRLSADDARAVEITLVPTTASATDSLKEAQRKEILNRAKVLSPQTWASQEGLDAAQETSNLQAHDEAFPDVGMNAGGMFDFGEPQRTPEPTLPESVQEGFTGTVTGADGHEYKYVDGKRVKGAADTPKSDGAGGAVDSGFPDRHKKGKNSNTAAPYDSLPLKQRAANKLFYDLIPDENVDPADLTGAPNGSSVTYGIRVHDRSGVIGITIDHPEFEAERTMGRDENGAVYISNDWFAVKEGTRGRGIGTSVFSGQVENAQAAGVSYLKCVASAAEGNNGYITWPKLGYDQSIMNDALFVGQENKIKECRQRFPSAKTVLDIISTKEGLEWWEQSRIEMSEAKFDLSPGSRSMKVLTAYLDAKAKIKRPSRESKNVTFLPTIKQPSILSGQKYTVEGFTGTVTGADGHALLDEEKQEE